MQMQLLNVINQKLLYY